MRIEMWPIPDGYAYRVVADSPEGLRMFGGGWAETKEAAYAKARLMRDAEKKRGKPGVLVAPEGVRVE